MLSVVHVAYDIFLQLLEKKIIFIISFSSPFKHNHIPSIQWCSLLSLTANKLNWFEKKKKLFLMYFHFVA